MGYDGDSFWTLGVFAQAGLVVWSVALAGTTLWLFARLSWRLARMVRVILALGVLWFWLWVSPQGYYLYYLLIFDDLPVQSVIKTPPSGRMVLEHLRFDGPATLSAHASGVLGWLLITLALLLRRR